jgi:hypothetical protein
LPYYKANYGQGSNFVETIDRVAVNGTLTSVSGIAYYAFFTPLESVTVDTITLATGTTAAASVTTIRAGLYTYDGTTATLVARTANDPTMFTSANTTFDRSFDSAGGYPESYTLVAGERYAFGVVIIATTMPSLVGCSTGSTASAGINALDPRISGAVTGQTELPVVRTSFSNTSFLVWARLS